MIFKKIRNKILLLNMVMVSSVVIVAFVVIFATTYTRIQGENRQKLLHGTGPQFTSLAGPIPVESIRAEPGPNGPVVTDFARRISPNAGLSFSVVIDSQNNVVDINSMVDLPNMTYFNAATEAVNASENIKTIAFEGRIWQFVITPLTVVFREPSSDALPSGMTTITATTISGEFNRIRFLDITDSYRTIRSLALMLAALTIGILTAFFFISRVFADRAILPMEEAWKKQNRFVADASHELKTPLAIISANCGALYAGKTETLESQIKWVNNIMRATDRMTGLVGDLLSLAHMDDQQFALQRYLFDLSETVRDVAEEIEAAALEKNLSVHKHVESGIEVVSHRESVMKLLSILLDNAVKYADENGEVSLSLKKERGAVVCAVRNNGGGIPAEELPHVFDRFYRGDPARSSDVHGYGLGLAIAKAIAKQLDIELTAMSIPGEYSEFRFTIAVKS